VFHSLALFGVYLHVICTLSSIPHLLQLLHSFVLFSVFALFTVIFLGDVF
jgi:hypothetical protein